MKPLLLLLILALSGCVTNPMSYNEWREKIYLETKAAQMGVSFKYKSHSQLRKEAEEMRQIVAETWESMGK